jgi:hypothetical protein
MRVEAFKEQAQATRPPVDLQKQIQSRCVEPKDDLQLTQPLPVRAAGMNLRLMLLTVAAWLPGASIRRYKSW